MYIYKYISIFLEFTIFEVHLAVPTSPWIASPAQAQCRALLQRSFSLGLDRSGVSGVGSYHGSWGWVELGIVTSQQQQKKAKKGLLPPSLPVFQFFADFNRFSVFCIFTWDVTHSTILDFLTNDASRFVGIRQQYNRIGLQGAYPFQVAWQQNTYGKLTLRRTVHNL